MDDLRSGVNSVVGGGDADRGCYLFGSIDGTCSKRRL
jgi:hypothetical protein